MYKKKYDEDYLEKKYDNFDLIVLENIPSKRRDAIKMSHLAEIMGVSAWRVKESIKRLREDFPIVMQETRSGGYWMAENQAQVREFTAILRTRCNSMQDTIDNMNALKGELPYE